MNDQNPYLATKRNPTMAVIFARLAVVAFLPSEEFVESRPLFVS